jgi:hypothetical protein
MESDLMNYSQLLSILVSMLDATHVYGLWHDVFGDAPPDVQDPLDLECEFVWRVNEELFPIDLNYMDSYVAFEEDPLNYPISIVGYRIPWESWATEDLPPHVRLLAACLAGHRRVDDDSLVGPAIPWLSLGMEHTVESALQRLSCLDAPFNALSDLVGSALRSTNNVFLDWSGMMFDEEDFDMDAFYWDVSNVHWLASQFAQARPAVERIQSFAVWFETLPPDEANQRILDALREAGND